MSWNGLVVAYPQLEASQSASTATVAVGGSRIQKFKQQKRKMPFKLNVLLLVKTYLEMKLHASTA